MLDHPESGCKRAATVGRHIRARERDITPLANMFTFKRQLFGFPFFPSKKVLSLSFQVDERGVAG
jgi:hypothetical protein